MRKKINKSMGKINLILFSFGRTLGSEISAKFSIVDNRIAVGQWIYRDLTHPISNENIEK